MLELRYIDEPHLGVAGDYRRGAKALLAPDSRERLAQVRFYARRISESTIED